MENTTGEGASVKTMKVGELARRAGVSIRTLHYYEELGRGTDPGHPRVQALSEKARALIEEYTGGDPGIEESLASLYQQEGHRNVLQPHGFDTDDGLWQYMARARCAADGSAEG